jgi:hypothetical protein
LFCLILFWLLSGSAGLKAPSLPHYPGIERFRQPLDLKAASFCDAGARIDDL